MPPGREGWLAAAPEQDPHTKAHGASRLHREMAEGPQTTPRHQGGCSQTVEKAAWRPRQTPAATRGDYFPFIYQQTKTGLEAQNRHKSTAEGGGGACDCPSLMGLSLSSFIGATQISRSEQDPFWIPL